MKHDENKLQAMVCKYLKIQYPRVLFISDLSGINKNIGERVRHKANSKEGFSCPDLIIFKKEKGKGALFLELKAKTIYKKNGELLSNEHLEKQKHSIDMLNMLGYQANFVVGFDEAKNAIDDYLKVSNSIHLK